MPKRRGRPGGTLGGVAVRKLVLEVSVPGLRALRWSTDELYSGMKETYTVARVEAGQSEWWARGKIWRVGPGSLQITRPGDVHRDVARDGPGASQIVAFPASAVEGAIGRVRVPPELAPGDERGAAFRRLHDAVTAGADRLALEVAIAEALDAFVRVSDTTAEPTRPVRRALEFLRERVAEPVTLDDLAAHAGFDKFHLCRAFRAQVGLPPHAYLTQLRVVRAKELLAAGVRPSEVAPQVGLYDQSQLNRHFRRIVGTTPGRYAREHAAG